MKNKPTSQYFQQPLYLLLLSSFLLFVACSGKKEKIPPDIIPREKMISILCDMEELEARLQLNNLNLNDSTRKIGYGYYKFVFQKHHIGSADFKKSFDYYAQHLGMLDKMYEEVITELSRRQAEAVAKSK